MYDTLPKYKGYLVRHPATEGIIDARPFGYLNPETAALNRLRRWNRVHITGYTNSEARNR
jgi:hypothetical protein